MRKSTITSLSAALVMFCIAPASPAHAGAISSAITGASLAPNDSDFFNQGQVNEGNVIFGITTPIGGLPNDFNTPNTQLATFVQGNLATQLTFNDDSLAHFEPGQSSTEGSLGSLFRLKVDSTDTYLVGVTGFDDQFSGSGHNESGNYLLSTGHVDPSTTGGDFADTDPTNDVFSGADVITLGNFESKVAVNELANVQGGDVDFFRIELHQGDVFTAMTAPLGGLDDEEENFDFPDTVMYLLRADDSDVIELFHDDDSGSETSDSPTVTDGQWGSALHFQVPATDTYYVAVSGYNTNLSLEMSHSEKGLYALLVSRVGVPEPSTFTLFVLAGLPMLTSMRRRKK